MAPDFNQPRQLPVEMLVNPGTGPSLWFSMEALQAELPTAAALLSLLIFYNHCPSWVQLQLLMISATGVQLLRGCWQLASRGTKVRA